ncbi:MAG: heavy metal translocating P-type ATPase [Ruminococcaceae bacterium]|nr:heavy metal translocating P-type ATPase [Oscillospiraceae bacterium]
MKLKFEITGMTCAACSARVEKVSRGVSGVSDVQVNLMNGTMVVDAADDNVCASVIQAVTNAGYGAKIAGEKAPVQKENGTAKQGRSLILSCVFLVVLMYFSMGHMVGLPMPGWYSGTENALVAALLQFTLTLPVVLLNQHYYLRGFKALWHRNPNMDSLIAVGSGAALCYGVIALFLMASAMGRGDWQTVVFYRKNLYFESAAMILTLISVGKLLEGRAKGKTGDAIRALMDLRPETATVLRDGVEITIPVGDVRLGEIVIVRSGGRIPVDGIVIEGRGTVDQSALTGESVPVEAAPGQGVATATILNEGFIKIRVEKVGEDTTLQQIIRMVEEAGGSKAPIARLADKIAGVFVPVVMGIALVTFLVWFVLGYGLEFSLTCAISVLVISCPCALGLATPVAILVGTGKGASMGVLFKNGAALEQLHNVDTVVLDKTGTLTTGKPAVTDVKPDAVSEEELLTIAAALEKQSEHPFAKAIMEKVGQRDLPQAVNFETLAGLGVAAEVGGKRYLGGNARLMAQYGIEVPDYQEYAHQGKTPLYFADAAGVYLGAVFAADVLKEDSQEAVAVMKRAKLHIVMLTGDNEKTAAAIGKTAGIDHIVSDVLPGDKASVIKQLQAQGKKVLMVGDGINDAPALVTADVGMAIGAGTDIAMESADVVLMSSRLSAVAGAIALSKATIRNIKQNLFWAFFYNCLGIPVAAGVLFVPFGIQLSPMIGAAAMSMSSVFVVSNALRLRRFSYKKKEAAIEETVQKEEKDMTTVLKVEGMMCVHCKATVEKVCKAVPGAEDAVVDLQQKTVTVTGNADKDALSKAITDAGYEVIG